MSKEFNALRSICGDELLAISPDALSLDDEVSQQVYLKCAEKVCRGYKTIRSRLVLAEQDLADLEAKGNGVTDTVVKKMIADLVQEKQNQMEGDQWLVLLFDAALVTLDVNEKNVIQQLYVDGKKWANVIGLDGRLMSVFQISKYRRAAMKKISAMIWRMTPIDNN